MSEPFIGEIRAFCCNFAPSGWAFCQGQLLPIEQNTTLFQLLGVNYGGDGQTTFALPDLRGRRPVGVGLGPGLSNYVQGQSGGAEGITLAAVNLPPHTHSLTPPVATTSTSANPAGLVPGLTSGAAYGPAGQVGAAAGQTTAAGSAGPQPIDNRSPYAVVNWCIALEGTFPPFP